MQRREYICAGFDGEIAMILALFKLNTKVYMTSLE